MAVGSLLFKSLDHHDQNQMMPSTTPTHLAWDTVRFGEGAVPTTTRFIGTCKVIMIKIMISSLF